MYTEKLITSAVTYSIRLLNIYPENTEKCNCKLSNLKTHSSLVILQLYL